MVQNAQNCVAPSGDKMNSLDIFEIDPQIKGKTFKHQINVIDQLNDNIIGIDFMHKHKLNYDMQTQQIKIASIDAGQIVAFKEQVLPALISTIINTKFKGLIDKKATYIASIHTPRTLISSMHANNNCKIIVNNCTLYNIILNCNDVIGIMDVENEDLIPLEDSVISSILNDKNAKLPKVPKKKLAIDEIAQKANLNVPSDRQGRDCAPLK